MLYSLLEAYTILEKKIGFSALFPSRNDDNKNIRFKLFLIFFKGEAR